MFKLKNTITLAIIAVIVLSILPIHHALALELQYPDLPGGYKITPYSSLSQYIQYVFVFAVFIAGIIGVLSIVFSGLQILVFAGSPAARSAATERIRDAILGIVLLMSSFIILRTINPALINPLEQPFGTNSPGLYFRGRNVVPNCPQPSTLGGCIDDAHPDGYTYKPVVGQDFATTAFDIPLQFDTLFYYCPGTTASTAPKIWVWSYKLTKYEIYDHANPNPTDQKTFVLNCQTTTNTTNGWLFRTSDGLPHSFHWRYEQAGVLFYLQNNCEGIASCFGGESGADCVEQGDTNIPDSFDGTDVAPPDEIKSIKIINDPADDFNYDIILNDSRDFNGECSDGLIGTSPDFGDAMTTRCISKGTSAWPKMKDKTAGVDWSDPASDIDFNNIRYLKIIKEDRNYPESAQEGVTFYSENYFLSYPSAPPEDPNTPSIGPGLIVNESLDDVLRAKITNDNPDPLNPELTVSQKAQWREIKWEKCEEDPPQECDADDPEAPCDRDWDGNLTCIPQDECRYADPTNPEIEGDATFAEKEYSSCINTFTANGNYTITIYTENPSGRLRKCQVFDPTFQTNVTFNKDMPIFSKFQDLKIYQADITPTVP